MTQIVLSGKLPDKYKCKQTSGRGKVVESILRETKEYYRKDYIQVFKVMKMAARNDQMLAAFGRIVKQIPGGWRRKMEKSMEDMRQHIEAAEHSLYDQVVAPFRSACTLER